MARDDHPESPPSLATRTARGLGAFYSPPDVTSYLARWGVRSCADDVLEPAMGDGAFMRAIAERRSDLATGSAGPGAGRLRGIEIASDTFADLVARGVVAEEDAIHGDFLSVDPFPVDCVIGNPPFVRFRNLPEHERARAIEAAREVLGARPRSSGSSWLSFVLHATRFLRPGGRLALVLPFESTYVDYARPMWELLGASFDDLQVIRINERMFPDLLQECVLLLADGHGGRATSVQLRASNTRAAAFGDAPAGPAVDIPIDVLVRSRERAFDRALMPKAASDLLAALQRDGALVELGEVLTLRIGYVAGAKSFFHPSVEERAGFSLPSDVLQPTLVNGKALKGGGVRTSSIHEPGMLFAPGVGELDPASRRYVAYGEQLGIDDGYKCSRRQPWYHVPPVAVPDIVLSVFGELPVLAVNDAGLCASNSLLGGYVRRGSAELLAGLWYTNLTRLMLELHVHSLGGGVFVMVPREAAALQIVNPELLASHDVDHHLERLHALVSAGRISAALELGDRLLLRDVLGLDDGQVGDLRAAQRALAAWRTSDPQLDQKP